jgi:hypothetical protein
MDDLTEDLDLRPPRYRVLSRAPTKFWPNWLCQQYAKEGPPPPIPGMVPRLGEVYRVVKTPLGWECRGYSREALMEEAGDEQGRD